MATKPPDSAQRNSWLDLGLTCSSPRCRQWTTAAHYHRHGGFCATCGKKRLAAMRGHTRTKHASGDHNLSSGQLLFDFQETQDECGTLTKERR